jgi:hypothetical protein
VSGRSEVAQRVLADGRAKVAMRPHVKSSHSGIGASFVEQMYQVVLHLLDEKWHTELADLQVRSAT